jgi:hypothetical protein
MLNDRVSSADILKAGVTMNPTVSDAIKAPAMHYRFECLDKDGKVKWVEEFDNLVTTVGKTDIIDKYLKGSAYTASWFLGLKGTGTAVVGDTMASHAGWSELVPYAAATRPAITWGTTSAGSNTSTAVSIAINGTATVAGAFVVNDNTKSGSSGTLYSAGDFAASRSVLSGDTLNVTVTQAVT